MSLSNHTNTTHAMNYVDQRVWDKVESRLDEIRNRRSSKAARDFFAQGHSWRTLPQRLATLTQTLQEWIIQEEQEDDMDTENHVTLELPFEAFVDSVSVSSNNTDAFSRLRKAEAKRIAMTAAIMAQAPPSFYSQFERLFTYCIDVLNERNEAQGNIVSMDDENEVPEGFSSLIPNLQTLGWLRPKTGLVRKAFFKAIHAAVRQNVQETIAGDYETHDLYGAVQQWRDKVIAPFLEQAMNDNSALQQENWQTMLEGLTAEGFCLVRMKEIFDVVADFPDSRPAVLELRDVLETTHMHHDVAKALRSSLVRRLNHPGANTSQIIDVYISTIKVLRLIDKSDRLLSLVAEPVRTYLRARSDTVRCIITSLTDAEVGGDLYQELRRRDAKPLENVTVDSDDEEECPDFSWQPPPSIYRPTAVLLESCGGRNSQGESDILAMLVSIYESKELFVNEYRLMLAYKLLANLDFNTDKEVHTLELLKLRFGELSMRNCEVMIKDMDDSKRTNSNIFSTLEARKATASDEEQRKKPVVDVAIVSHIFWPALQTETMKHHPRIQADLDEYSAEYARLKNPRKLIWLDQLGAVQLELDVEEEQVDDTGRRRTVTQTKEFTCAPLLATLISHFEDKPQWTASELSNETGVPDYIVQKKMSFWTNNRVIKVVASRDGFVYELASGSHSHDDDGDPSADPAYRSMMMMMDDDEDGSEGQAVSASAQEEEEMQVFESYIVGMLTNLQQLPLLRIHDMLKTFVAGSEIKYNKTPKQLSVFLQHLCKQEKLECGPDGMYKLFKK